MATKPHTARAHAWASTISQIDTLTLALNQAQQHERIALERQIVALQDNLMTLRAPSLAAVAEKLQILWSASLEHDPEQRLILIDIANLRQDVAQPQG